MDDAPDRDVRSCPVVDTDYRIDRPAFWHYQNLNEVREASPLYWNTSVQGFWMVTRYAEIREALQNPAVFTNDAVSPFEPHQELRLLPQLLNPPEHVKYRHILNPWFSPGSVARIEPMARSRCAILVDELVAKGSCAFVTEFGIVYPTEVFLAMLGLPVEDGERFLPWVEAIFSGFFGGDPQASANAVGSTLAYFDEVTSDRERRPWDPREGFVTHVLQAKVVDQPLPRAEVLTICLTLMLAGLDTTRSQLGYIFHHLATHADDRQRLIDEPALLPSAIEEFCRLYSLIITAGRYVASDIDFHGCPMRAGDVVWLGLSSANRDPRVVEHPDEFVPDRAPNPPWPSPPARIDASAPIWRVARARDRHGGVAPAHPPLPGPRRPGARRTGRAVDAPAPPADLGHLMRTVALGRAGLEVSALGLGCMVMSGMYGTPDADESMATFRRAVELGITLFDTADSYSRGENESFVGRVVRPYRTVLKVATKFGLVARPDGTIGVNGRAEYARSCCDASLRRLGLDHIDLYYLHRIDPAVPVEETVGAMSALVASGKVGHLGLCEASGDELRRAHAIHPITASAERVVALGAGDRAGRGASRPPTRHRARALRAARSRLLRRSDHVAVHVRRRRRARRRSPVLGPESRGQSPPPGGVARAGPVEGRDAGPAGTGVAQRPRRRRGADPRHGAADLPRGQRGLAGGQLQRRRAGPLRCPVPGGSGVGQRRPRPSPGPAFVRDLVMLITSQMGEKMETGYLLARIQLKYGAAERFTEIMKHLVPILEKNGWRLHGAYQTRIGRLWEVWDVWEVPGASGVESVLGAAVEDPEFQEWASYLPECVEEEELRYLLKLPYAP